MRNPITTITAIVVALGTFFTQLGAWLGGEPRSALDLLQMLFALLAAFGLYKARDPE